MADAPVWSSSTAYYSGAANPRPEHSRVDYPHSDYPRPDYPQDTWAAPTTQAVPAGPPPGYRDPRDARNSPDPRNGADPRAVSEPTATRSTRTQERRATRQRGLPGWAALLVLLAIAGIGGLIDTLSGNNVRGGFNIALVVAAIVGILVVRHRDMFPIVVAPPLVYIVASGVTLYIRSGGLHDRKILIDAAANWLVYGFPAIAGASAAVLIIAGIRLVVGK